MWKWIFSESTFINYCMLYKIKCMITYVTQPERSETLTPSRISKFKIIENERAEYTQHACCSLTYELIWTNSNFVTYMLPYIPQACLCLRLTLRVNGNFACKSNYVDNMIILLTINYIRNDFSGLVYCIEIIFGLVAVIESKCYEESCSVIKSLDLNSWILILLLLK